MMEEKISPSLIEDIESALEDHILVAYLDDHMVSDFTYKPEKFIMKFHEILKCPLQYAYHVTMGLLTEREFVVMESFLGNCERAKEEIDKIGLRSKVCLYSEYYQDSGYD